MLNDLIPNLSEAGLKQLEEHFKQLLEALTQKAQQADVTWQSLLHGYLFHPEAQRIIAYLNEYCVDTSPEKKREIRLALQMNECQFDCDTVSAYLRQGDDRRKNSLLSPANQGTDFQSYIRVKSRQRVEH